MKIIQMSELKGDDLIPGASTGIDPEGKKVNFSHTTNEIINQPLYAMLTGMAKKVGIKWVVSSNFTLSKNIDKLTNTPKMQYTKKFSGTINKAIKSAPDFLAAMDFQCSNNKDNELIEEKVTISIVSYATAAPIVQWDIYVPTDDLISEVMTPLGFIGSALETPKEFEKKNVKEKINIPVHMLDGNKPVYYYHRITRIQSDMYNPYEMELYIKKIESNVLSSSKGFIPIFRTKDLLSQKASAPLQMTSVANLSLEDAIKEIDKNITKAKASRGYVGPDSPLYLPVGVNKDNWNFEMHRWKTEDEMKKSKSIPNVEPEAQPIQSPKPVQNVQPTFTNVEEPSYSGPSLDSVLDDDDDDEPFNPFKITAQSNYDFEGYYSGDIGKLDTQGLNASEISSAFNRANDAVQLAQSYPGGGLENVNYIFNYSKSGSYGIYVPELERAQRTEKLKKILEQQRGYKVIDENGILAAYPVKESKSEEEIKKEIDVIWSQIQSTGGHVLGVNMNESLSAATENANQIVNDAKNKGGSVPDPQLLWQMLAILSVSSTIIHEAAHTKGADEGGAQSVEQGFATWAIDQINGKYQQELQNKGLGDLFEPIQLTGKTRHAKATDWYKVSQNYNKPGGSDLRGRFQSETFADWGMLIQQDQSIPIERRLDRSYMAKLEKDVDQEHNSIEEQLRKQFRGDSRPNVQLIMEELLAPDRDESQGYKTMEELLEERRPQPLMTPIKKASIQKEAGPNCLFGWYNNLEISDGSTIPGLSDRVMAWDDRDESFSAEEQTIKSQSRYNPTYDLKGFYMRWIEPRFKPSLFDDMSRDYSNTTPALRFAGTLDPSLTQMLSVLKLIDDEIINEEIKATRLVITEELIEVIRRLLGKEGISLKAFHVKDNENVLAIWIHNGSISDETLAHAEEYFQNEENSEQYKDLVEDLLQSQFNIKSSVQKVIKMAKEIGSSYEVKDIYILGEYARNIAQGQSNPLVTELEFVLESIDNGIKIAYLMADKLNVPQEYIINGNFSISFPYKGILISFSKSPSLDKIEDAMSKKGLDVGNPIARTICNKDFTINMLAYNIIDGKVSDYIGAEVDIKNKKVRTLFNSDFIIQENPMVILRAISLKMDGFEIDEELERSIIENAYLLEKSKYSPERLSFAREYLKSKGKSKLEDLVIEYGLPDILTK